MGEFIIIRTGKLNKIILQAAEKYKDNRTFMRPNETYSQFKGTRRHELQKRILADLAAIRERIIDG